MEIKVRFNEADMLGHVNNAIYFTYMEEGRLSFLEELGADFFNDKNYTIVLVSATCDFIKQGYFNDILTVKTSVGKIGNSSFHLISDIINKDSNELIAKGEVTVVYFDVNQQKSANLPDSFKEKLKRELSE